MSSSMLEHVWEFPSFLRLSNIALFEYTTPYLFIYPSMDTELPPLVGGGAIVSDVTVNMGVQISVQVLGFISSEDGIFLEIKLLVNTVKFFFFFFWNQP